MLYRTLSVNEAASYLKVQPRTVRAWILGGKISASKVGKGYVIPEHEIETMIYQPRHARSDNPFERMSKQERMAFLREKLSGCSVTSELVLQEREERRKAITSDWSARWQ